jgi:hypothetical protein
VDHRLGVIARALVATFNVVMAGLVPAISFRGARASMLEMPCPGKDHGDTVVVGGFDHFIVAH